MTSSLTLWCQICKLLGEIAHGGSISADHYDRNWATSRPSPKKTILCTIHQPTFRTLLHFDQVLVLQKGHLVYNETPRFLPEYLKLNRPTDDQRPHYPPKTINPIDFFFEELDREELSNSRELQAAASVEPGPEATKIITWKSRWADRAKNQSGPILSNEAWTVPSGTDPSMRDLPVSDLDKTCILFKRSLHVFLKSPSGLRLLVVANVLIALLIGITFYDCGFEDKGLTVSNSLFATLLATFLMHSLLTIVTVPLEKTIVCRETASGSYPVSAFWAARVGLYLCTVLGLGLFVVPILYSLIGFRATFERIMAFYGVWVLISFFAMVLALTVGSLVPNVSAAVQKVCRCLHLLLV